jgi:23S rRNA pseudouridine2605 synthase
VSKVEEGIFIPSKIRIAKFLADKGICSRRQAEFMIYEGRVTLNGEKLKTKGIFVNEKDEIKIDGKKIDTSSQKKMKIYCLNKPVGYVCTRSDEKGRPTIFELVPPSVGYVVKVGRLDINSEGLLLLTNSGELAHRLETPEYNIERTYLVKIFGFVDKKKVERLSRGVTIDKVSYRPTFVEIAKDGNKYPDKGKREGDNFRQNTWLRIGLRTGKNREIRNLLRYFNLQVTRLIRERYGNIRLDDMPKNAFAEIADFKVEKLLKIVGMNGE